jgi:hypothetical protein
MTTETTAVASDPVSLTRNDFDQNSRVKHGKCTLPDGRVVYFMPSRRSRNFAIDGALYNDDGKLVEPIETRPARYLAGYLCDAEGTRIYRDDEWEAVDSLKPSIFDPAWEGLRKHLGMDIDKGDTAKN